MYASTLELPEAFLKRWLVYANEGKFTAEQVEQEFPAFVEDFKWQLVRGSLMQKFGLKVSQADMQAAAESFVAYQYAMYGMAGVPENLIKSSAENVLQDQNQRRRKSSARTTSPSPRSVKRSPSRPRKSPRTSSVS